MTVVVDTSAIIAVLFGEPEREAFYRLLATRPTVMSAGSVIELMRVVARRTPDWIDDAHVLLEQFDVSIANVDRAQVAFAVEGQARFGTGRARPPAVLNFGDLFAYALARQLDAPLLFKGNDFRRTDVRSAL